MAGSRAGQRQRPQSRRQLSHQQQLQRTVQNVTQRAMYNASRRGFQWLQSGDQLCPNNSASSVATELQTDLAARQIEHCLEAWNFLSQATWALLNGQDNQAIHMAYYAEIRAANSLLASTGIAEKERPAYFLNQSSQRQGLRVRTHEFIREVWPLWCQRTDAVEAYNKLKVVQSVSLADIGQALNLTTQGNSVHLQAWGYELIHFNGDHTERNNASYRTQHAYSLIPKLDEKKHTEIIALAWEHLLPGGVDGQMQFEIIYARYLIYWYCMDFATQAAEPDAEATFNTKLNSVLTNLSDNTGVDVATLKYTFDLTTEEEPLFQLFDLASSPDTNAENIYARAVILTRITTSKLHDNISITRCKNALDWIEAWLGEAGVLNNGDTPADVSAIAEDFVYAAQESAKLSLRDVWSVNPRDAAMSCKVNTSICWGLGY